MLYEAKIKVNREDRHGEVKEVKEHYIMDAESHGDAEQRAYGLNGGKVEDVFAVFRSGVYEIVNDKEDDKPFYMASIVQTITDDNGKEKEQKYPVLVCAENLVAATEFMTGYLRQGYDDMRLDAIRKVKIVDYIKY